MGMLVDGQWDPHNQYADPQTGAFKYQPTHFHDWIRADGSSRFPAEKGRYHLYVANACPWCHRTMIVRELKGLQDVVSISSVHPLVLERGWTFAEPDPLTGVRYVYELYQRADPRCTGRVTVPILWDKQRGTIVNNESSEIIRMLNTEFAAYASCGPDLYPAALAAEIDAVNARVQETVNAGVYKSGFATRQDAYEKAVRELFASLDWLEERLLRQRYLLGERVTEADWRLFPTLVRFDSVYHNLFKCNLRHLHEYPALWAYTRELSQWPGIARTISLDEYRMHYFGSMRHLNPAGIVPLGPTLDLAAPHGRG